MRKGVSGRRERRFTGKLVSGHLFASLPTLLAEHEHDHLWGQTEGCPKQGALKHTDDLGLPLLLNLNLMEEARESAFYKVILTYTKAALLKQQRNHLWILRSAGSGSLGLGEGPRFCILTSSQAMSLLLVHGPHSE